MALLTTSKELYQVGSIVVTHGPLNSTLTAGAGSFVVADFISAGSTTNIVFTLDSGLKDHNSTRKTVVGATVLSATTTTLVVSGLDIPAATYASSEFDRVTTTALAVGETELTLRHSFNADNQAANAIITISGGGVIGYDISVKGVIDGIHMPVGSTVTPVDYGTTYVLTS